MRIGSMPARRIAGAPKMAVPVAARPFKADLRWIVMTIFLRRDSSHKARYAILWSGIIVK
jgi:hypothetical protein